VAFASAPTDIRDACARKSAEDGGLLSRKKPPPARPAAAAAAPPSSTDDSDGSDADAADQTTPNNNNNNKTTKKPNPPPCPSDREPLSWFFEHQARCEADFQARRRELRALARERLRLLFRRQRGAELVRERRPPKTKPNDKDNKNHNDNDPDAPASPPSEGDDSSDNSDWSVGDTELSAWDSDVASLLDQGSLAESAAEEEAFEQPARAWLLSALVGCGVVGAASVLASFYASSTIASFGGVVYARAWVPKLGAVAGGLLLAAALWTWAQGERRLSRRGLAAGHALLTLALAGGCVVASLALGAPAMLDPRVRAACAAAAGGSCSASASSVSAEGCGGRTGGTCPAAPTNDNGQPTNTNASAYAGICGARIEAYDARLGSAMRLAALVGVGVALCASACSAAAVARCWELAHVAQRAAKHRTRRRRRARNGKIPWHKLRIVGPVTTCGGGGGGSGGGCPFAAAGGKA
jgi:hypothetical protein